MSSNLLNNDAFDHDSLTVELNAQHDLDREAIFMNMFNTDDAARAFTFRDGIMDRELLKNIDIDLEVMPQIDYRAWDPQNNVLKVVPRYLQVEEMKVDLEFEGQKMQRTYMAKYSSPGADQFDLGPYEWLLSHISDAIAEKLLLQAYYLGVRDNTGVTTTDTMDGRNKLIADALTAGDLIAVATGAISYATVVDDIETLCIAHDSSAKWGKKPSICPVSPQIFTWYWQKRREKYPYIVTVVGELQAIDQLPVEGFNVTLIKEYGLTGSQRLCITQKSNIIIGADSSDKRNKMEFQRSKRIVNGLMDFRIGEQFAYLFTGSCTVNDVA